MEGVEREKKKEIREMEGDKGKVIKIKHTLWYIHRSFFFTATEEERVGVCDYLYVCEGGESSSNNPCLTVQSIQHSSRHPIHVHYTSKY